MQDLVLKDLNRHLVFNLQRLGILFYCLVGVLRSHFCILTPSNNLEPTAFPFEL